MDKSTIVFAELPEWPPTPGKSSSERRADFVSKFIRPLYGSLGLNPDRYREEQEFKPASLTKVRIFGVDITVPALLQKDSKWLCRVGWEEGKFIGFYVGDFLWAARVFKKGNHLLDTLPEDIHLLSIRGSAFDLKSLPRFRALEHLDLSVPLLVELGPLAGLANLASLSLAGCSKIIDLSPLAGLLNLVGLDLRSCESVTEINPLASLTKLDTISLYGCERVSDLSPLSGLRNLRSLNLRNCKAVRDISPIAKLRNLKSIDLSHCQNLADLSPLASLVNLEEVKLGDDTFQNTRLSDLSPLSGLRKLKKLSITSCDKLSDISPLSKLVNLRSLHLSRCELLTDLSPLASLIRLESLDLGFCSSLSDIGALSKLERLRIINLGSCRNLSDIAPLSELKNLEVLGLSGCELPEGLSPLSGLRSLTSIDLSGCKSLVDLSPLAVLTSLEEIELGNCSSVTNLTPLSSLANLRVLGLFSCRRIFDLGTLKTCRSLERVVLTGLSRINSLEPLRELKHLRDLGASTFSQLHFHPGIVAELLAHAAWRRRDITYVLDNGAAWIRESCDFENEGHPFLQKISSTLGEAFSLLGESALGDSLEKLLDRHPEFTSAPWKAWFGGTLKESGFDLYRQRIERVPVAEMTSGAIGGACVTLPLEEQLDWSRQWLADLEKSRLGDAKMLLPVAPEICLAFARSGDREALRRWLEAFTDPSDPAALDPVHAALAKFQIGGGDLAAAENHVHAIHSPAARDPIVGELVIHLAASDGDLASASLLLIEDQALRIDLAKKLMAKASASEVFIHRCIVAAGDSPQAVADLISALPQTSRSELVVQLSKKLQTDRKTVLLGIADELRRQADRLSAQALEVD